MTIPTALGLSAPTAPTALLPTSGLAAGPTRALVVDPDAKASQALADTLAALGYAATTVRTAGEAVALLRDRASSGATAPTGGRPFTLLFISDTLADMDPFDCYRRVRRLLPECSGVLLAATADVNLVFSAIAAGFSKVLAKPVDAIDVVPLL